LSIFRRYILGFQVGKKFEENLMGVDDHKYITTVSWDGDKLKGRKNGEKVGHG
jgi:hypothetical protein